MTELKDCDIVRHKHTGELGSVDYIDGRNSQYVLCGGCITTYHSAEALTDDWEHVIVCGRDEIPVNVEEIDPALEEFEETGDIECARYIALHVLETKEKYFPSKVVPEEPTEFGARVTVTRPDGTQELRIRIGSAHGYKSPLEYPWYSEHMPPCNWEEVLERGEVTLDTED